MNWIMQLAVLWLSLDIVIIATCWFVYTEVRPRCPQWWQQHIADDEPACLRERSIRVSMPVDSRRHNSPR